MALKNIAVEGMTLTFDPITNPEWEVKSPTDFTCFVDNNGVYSGPVVIQLTAGTYGSDSLVSAPPITLNGTAQFNLADNKPVLLEGDQVQGTAVFTSSSEPYTQDVNFVCKVAVAGQDTTQGD